MRHLRKVALLAGALALSSMLATSAQAQQPTPSPSPPSAQPSASDSPATPNQFCMVVNGTSIWMNAWNNGPYIATYSSCTANGEFQLVAEGGGAVAFQYVNTSSHYYAGFIGDCGDSTTNYQACVNNPGGLPWGANMIQYSCPGGIAFKDNHSGKWFAPHLPAGNGDGWFLNSSYEACFAFQY